MTAEAPARRDATRVRILVADGVRASARRTPEKVALIDGERQLRYRHLVERIDRVSSGALHGLGLRPGQHSAILAPSCLEFIELTLGLASAGTPPAHINARSSAAELEALCEDSEARVLFVHPSLAELARDARLGCVERIIVIGEEYERWLANASPHPADVELDEWDAFAIPYTAGTTGAPKGVLLPHRRALGWYAAGVEFGCYGPDDRAVAVAPLYHGAGFTFAVAPIFFGGTTTLLAKFEPEAVLETIERDRATNVFLVPTHFAAIFGLGAQSLAGFDAGSLRAIISSAAPLSQALKERIIARFGEILFECYGSTESGITTSLRPLDQLRKEYSIGLPFPGSQLRLLDDDGAEVATGEIGELYSRTPYRFAGYWKRPEETDEGFRGAWFTSGDLARQDEEGYVYLVDRKNDKIVSGGVNIYPREIEEAIARHPAVAETAVFGVPDDYWGEVVSAAVSLVHGGSLDAAALIAHCEEQGLARFKLPKGVEFHDGLPKNASGKILRRSLREPHWSGHERRIA